MSVPILFACNTHVFYVCCFAWKWIIITAVSFPPIAFGVSMGYFVRGSREAYTTHLNELSLNTSLQTRWPDSVCEWCVLGRGEPLTSCGGLEACWPTCHPGERHREGVYILLKGPMIRIDWWEAQRRGIYFAEGANDKNWLEVWLCLDWHALQPRPFFHLCHFLLYCCLPCATNGSVSLAVCGHGFHFFRSSEEWTVANGHLF